MQPAGHGQQLVTGTHRDSSLSMAFLGYSCGPWAHYEMPFDHLSRTWATWICSYGLCSYGLRSHGPYSHGTSSWSLGHDDKGHNYIDHKYVGHNHIGNSYTGHVFHLATAPMAECPFGSYVVMAQCPFGSYVVLAYVVMAHVLMARCPFGSSVVVAYIVMARCPFGSYVVMAYAVMAQCPFGSCPAVTRPCSVPAPLVRAGKQPPRYLVYTHPGLPWAGPDGQRTRSARTRAGIADGCMPASPTAPCRHRRRPHAGIADGAPRAWVWTCRYLY